MRASCWALICSGVAVAVDVGDAVNVGLGLSATGDPTPIEVRHRNSTQASMLLTDMASY